MAGKVRVNGTNYTITGGKCRVNGTNYSITNGKTRVGGTNYDITFSRGVLRATCRIYVANGSDLYYGSIYVNGKFYTKISGNDGTPQIVNIPADVGDEVEFSISTKGNENVTITESDLDGCSKTGTTYLSVTLTMEAQEASANIVFDIYN